MSGLSIHEKRQLAEQLAREQLSKSGQYSFGIPQSVLNVKANEFMRLSDKEIQQKFNEYFQSTGLNAKPKDLWDSMGLNLEQKKKAEAHMKGLQKQINKKYMRPASSNKKKTDAKQATNILPNDVKKETRQFMVALLKQAFNQKSEEFRNYLLNNKSGFAEGAMELHDLGSKFADKLTEIGIVVERGDTRAEIREKLIKKQAEIDVLESYVDDEKSFNELFKKYFNENFDYQSTFDYICASSEFTTQDSSKKIEKFNKKFSDLTKTNLKSADDYMGNASGAGGLMDLAFNVALMYVSGGSSAIAKYAQMTAKGGTEIAENAITKVVGKKLAQSSAGQAMSQGVGIVAAQTTSAGLNAVAFQGTKTAELAGETLATGEIDTEKAKNIVASAEGLFKFGYVGGAISGPLGMQVKGLTTKLLNSKPIINQILTKGITSRPAPLTSVLKDISEHSEAIGEVLKFGTEFGINAGYMAYDEGVSYTDAMKNLAQMDGVSKMVIAMLGGKNLEFLTPKKVQQIKTDLAGYKVNIAIYEGQKVYSVKDAKGKETVLATPEELFMFILDKEAQKVGVKAEHSNADNTPQPNTQEAREQGSVRSSEVEEVAPFAKRLLKSPTVEDLTNPEIKTVKLENGEINAQGEFVSDGTYTVAEAPLGKKQETYRIYSDGDKKLATTVEELALQYAHYCGREKAVKSDINAVEALLRGKDVTPQDISEIILDFNHATEGRENYNDGILSWKGLKTVKDLKTFKTNIREFDKFMTELKANNTDRDVLYELKNLRMDFISENLSNIKPEEFKKNLETFKNFDSEMQKGCMRADSNWCMKAHTEAEFNNLEITNEYNKWASAKVAEGNNNVYYFTYEAFKIAKLSPEKFAQAKKNIELVKEMVEGGSAYSHLMSEILTDSYDTSLYTDLHAKLKSDLGDKYDIKDFDKIFLSAYNDRGNYNFDFGIQFAKNYPNGFKHFGAYQIREMSEKFAQLDKSAQENQIAKLTILGKFPKFCEIDGKLQELSFDRFMSNDIQDAKNIADFINKSTKDSFKNFDFEYYTLSSIQGFVKAKQVGDSFDSKYTDTLLSMKLQRSDSEKAEILELAKIDKEFVNELLASKTGHKDFKRVYFRDKAVMDQLDGKTPETKSEQKADYDRVYNEYTAKDMKLLVEAKNIDEDMTRELMSAISDDGYGNRRRFSPEQINKIVKAAQADKAFVNEVINATVPSYGGKEEFRFDSETVTAVLGNISTCKDFMKEIINAKNSDKSSYHYGKYEYTNNDITNLAKSAKIDAEYTRELLNTYEEGYKNQIYKRFNSDGILNIITAGQNNKELMRELVNSSKESNFDKTQDPIYNANNIVQILNFEKNVEDKAFVKDIFADKEFTQNGLARVAETLNYRRDTELNTLFKELFYDKEIPNKCILGILEVTDKENIEYANDLCKNYEKYDIEVRDIAFLLKNQNEITLEQFKGLQEKVGNKSFRQLSENDIIVGSQVYGLIGSKNINEIPLSQKRSVLKQLVACNANLFGASEKLKELAPLIPTTQEEYCELLPSLVRSLGVETNKLSAEQIKNTNTSTKNLANSLAQISDKDFTKLNISQEYSREKFINTVLEKTKDLPETERQKVFDYYGFELLKNDTNKTGYTLYGYPVNLNNGHKLAEISDVKTKAVVEDLRNDVVNFSKNNRIKCENPQVEQFLNEIAEVLPEIRTMIGKAQHGNNGTRGAHDYDVMKHSLKVMQKISQDPKFAKLSESDKKVMLLASLMHDITKAEGHPDGYHAENGAFDVFFISKKFNLTSEEETKLYKICKYHEWLNFVNTSTSEGELTKRLQSVAFDLQQDNLVDMAEIFTHADLRAVKADDSFHDTKVGKSRVDFNGNVRSFGESADVYVARIKEYQKELQKSQPILPVTKFPQASRMKQAITTVYADGSTNLKGVYQDKDGVVVIKFNEMTDESWEAIGFPKGTSAKGVKAKGLNNSAEETDVETGNIHFFVHGLDYSNQLAKFDAFSLVDSDALLSVSYAERPESKYRFFRTQGVLLDIPTKYIYGGGNTDAGSGCGKNIQTFKDYYIFGGGREKDRLYISNLVKEATGMSDAEYVQFVKDNENKSMLEIEPADIREKIIQKFATINSNVRKGNREYNEMYGSNPQVMGVFAYSWEREVGQPIDFLNNIYGRTHFLKEYAKERDLPFIVFGD